MPARGVRRGFLPCGLTAIGAVNTPLVNHEVHTLRCRFSVSAPIREGRVGERHLYLTFATALSVVIIVQPDGLAHAQPIPDPARQPAVLNPLGESDDLLRGTVATTGTTVTVEGLQGADAGNSGLMLDADGFPIDPLDAVRITVIETD